MIKPRSLMAALVAATIPAGALAADLPFPTEINGTKVLTVVNKEAPGVRCNTNMQVAAEIQNAFKVPYVAIPVSVLGPGAKAPAVYYGDELIAVDGGAMNGMLSFVEVRDIIDMSGAEPQPKPGRLLEVKESHTRLKMDDSRRGIGRSPHAPSGGRRPPDGPGQPFMPPRSTETLYPA